MCISTETHLKFYMCYIYTLENKACCVTDQQFWFNVERRIKVAHFEDMYNTLISIIIRNKDQPAATLGWRVYQIMRKSAYCLWILTSIYF